MSLEQQVANLVAAANALTGEVAGKLATIEAGVAAKKAELDAWKAGARNEYPAVNLLANSRFKTDSNADGLPDGFFTFYSASATPPTYALIAPDGNAVAGSDAKIAADLIAFGPGSEYFNVSNVLKVTLPASIATGVTDLWSLNARLAVLRGLVSRGVYYYAKTTGTANINLYDQPGGNANLVPEYNKPAKAWLLTDGGTTEITFLLTVAERSAPLTLYLAAPWISTGYVDHVSSSIEGR